MGLTGSLGAVCLAAPDDISEKIGFANEGYFRRLALYLHSRADKSLYAAKEGGRDRLGPTRFLPWPSPEELAYLDGVMAGIDRGV
jgi:hypothetical protein